MAINEPEIFYATLRDSGDGNTYEITVDKKVIMANGWKLGDQLKVFIKLMKKKKRD